MTLLFASCQGPQMAAPTGGAAASACRITNVVDGDTVDMRCAGTGGFRARLTGYDTPESSEPRCSAEARAARAATERLRALVSTARTVEPRFGGVDRYGRQLVRLSLDGRDVGAILIAEGLAVRYSGGRRIDWCARLT